MSLEQVWLKTRESYISSVNGLCERCLAKDRYTPGHIVHHKEWLTPSNINDPMVTLNHENLEYLCQDCHNREHHEQNGVTVYGLAFDSNGNLVEKKSKKYF